MLHEDILIPLVVGLSKVGLDRIVQVIAKPVLLPLVGIIIAFAYRQFLMSQSAQNSSRSIGLLTLCGLEVASDRCLRDLRQLPWLPSWLSALERLTEILKSIARSAGNPSVRDGCGHRGYAEGKELGREPLI